MFNTSGHLFRDDSACVCFSAFLPLGNIKKCNVASYFAKHANSMYFRKKNRYNQKAQHLAPLVLTFEF